MELWVERPRRQATNQSAKKYIRKSCDLFGIFNISALPTKMMLCNLNLFPLSFPLVYILYKAVEIELL